MVMMRRAVVTMIPVAVPLTMAAVFAGLRRCMSARNAYNAGFAVYWLGWCLSVPAWLLGPRTAVRLVVSGRRLQRDRLILLALPIGGALATQLIPHRREVDMPTALTMVSTGLINAVGEELLWRGVFMHEVRHRAWLSQVWALIGFAAWHFAPQLILPSQLGRGRFVAGSAAVGLASTAAAWTSGGLRQVVVAHAMTDACGVRAARFRLGRASADAGRGRSGTA
jgi:membrane protease YdiL (CAAX protease family)